MIVLTKRNHEKFLVNHLQIEYIETIPESKIVMMNPLQRQGDGYPAGNHRRRQAVRKKQASGPVSLPAGLEVVL